MDVPNNSLPSSPFLDSSQYWNRKGLWLKIFPRFVPKLEQDYQSAFFEKLIVRVRFILSLCFVMDSLAIVMAISNVVDPTKRWIAVGVKGLSLVVVTVAIVTTFLTKYRIIANSFDFIFMLTAALLLFDLQLEGSFRTMTKLSFIFCENVILFMNVNLGSRRIPYCVTILSCVIILGPIFNPTTTFTSTSWIKQYIGESLAFFSSLFICFLVGVNYDRVDRETYLVVHLNEKKKEMLLRSKEKFDRLLANIFPVGLVEGVKESLSRSSEVNLSMYDEIDTSIFFADVCDYTKFGGIVDSLQLVELLNQFYSHLDDLCIKHNVEKISTIGDAFMCSSRFDNQNQIEEDNSQADFTTPLFNFALDMLHYLETFNRDVLSSSELDLPPEISWKCRAGIGKGTCTTALIGKMQMSFGFLGPLLEETVFLQENAKKNHVMVNESFLLALSEEDQTLFSRQQKQKLDEEKLTLTHPLLGTITCYQTGLGNVDASSSRGGVNGRNNTITYPKKGEESGDSQPTVENGEGEEEGVLLESTGGSEMGAKKRILCSRLGGFMKSELNRVFRTLKGYNLANLKEKDTTNFKFLSLCMFLFHMIMNVQTWFYWGEKYFVRENLYSFIIISSASVVSTSVSLLIVFLPRRRFYLLNICGLVNVAMMLTSIYSNASLAKEVSMSFKNFTLSCICLYLFSFPFSFPPVWCAFVIIVLFVIHVLFNSILEISSDLALYINIAYILLITVATFYGDSNLFHLLGEKRKLSSMIASIQRDEKLCRILTLSVLPKSTVERIESGQNVQDVLYGSSMFVKIEGYLNFFRENRERAIQFLHQICAEFDTLIEDERCTKIKSFQSSFLVISGVEGEEDHIERLMTLSIRMRKAMRGAITRLSEEQEQQQRGGGLLLYCKIGINSGPFVGAVVGKLKYLYDVFGHEINKTSRLMELCKPWEIALSEDSFNLLRERSKESMAGDYVEETISLKGIGNQKVIKMK